MFMVYVIYKNDTDNLQKTLKNSDTCDIYHESNKLLSPIYFLCDIPRQYDTATYFKPLLRQSWKYLSLIF